MAEKICFASTSSEERQKILDECGSKNTNRATKSNVNIFEQYLKDKNLKEFNEIEDNELPAILEQFYMDLQKCDGDFYKLQSLKCIHAGINRKTKECRNLDIISDVHFSSANEVFKGVTKRSCVNGKGSTKSYKVISEGDLERLAEFFDHNIMNHPDPRKLQRCVIFYIIYFFGWRGRENLYEMQIDKFDIATDADGKQYVFQAIDEFDKTTQ